MEKRTCQHCAFAGRVHNGEPGELICVNCPIAPGEPVRVQPDGTCPNFLLRHRRVRPLPTRSAPPPPPTDEVCFIPLTKGQYAMVDAADYPELSKYKWTTSGAPGRYYATRRERNRTIYLHRQLMQPPPGMVTDHIDHNTLNDRRGNLRNCTQRENQWSSRGRGGVSGFKGVWYLEDQGKYTAGLCIDGKRVSLGSFDDPVEAARVRDEKAADAYGPYAFINLPEMLTPRPVPRDPNHPERPITFTGRHGYLRCPPYLALLPDGSRRAGPALSGVRRIARFATQALNCDGSQGNISGSSEVTSVGPWV